MCPNIARGLMMLLVMPRQWCTKDVCSAHLWMPATHERFEHVQNCWLATHPFPPAMVHLDTAPENPDAVPVFNLRTKIIRLLPTCHVLSISPG